MAIMTDDQQNKLAAIRALMKADHIDAYIIPHGDAYQSEFLPACAQRLQYITGFTGSAGYAVIMQKRAMIASDARYTLQLRDQINADLFEIYDSTQCPLKLWLYENIEKGGVVGFDPALIPVKSLGDICDHVKDKKITLRPVAGNYIDRIWHDRPAPPRGDIFAMSPHLAGKSVQEKHNDLKEYLVNKGLSAIFIAEPEAINWMLNMRGRDITYTPLTLCRALVDESGIHIFTPNVDQMDRAMRPHWPDFIKIYDEFDFAEFLTKQQEKYKKIGVTPEYLSAEYKQQFDDLNIRLAEIANPVTIAKAQKNDAEIVAIKKAHHQDGLALVKFSAWLSAQDPSDLDEIAIEKQLESFRAQDPSYICQSFPTIAGFGAHGAIVHYRASPKTNMTCTSGNLLLLDSGGQYFDAVNGIAGTTDITRTYALGDVALISDVIKMHYTLVLKGHIALAMARFKKDATGMELDKLARGPLQDHGLDFAHGTGHGVGCYLAVHEWAASISPRGKDVVKPGMLISNEPGYYEEGSHGIRIENLVFVTQGQGKDMEFETITLCPVETKLIQKNLLSAEEINWLNAYHASVYDALSPDLDAETKDWLCAATQSI